MGSGGTSSGNPSTEDISKLNNFYLCGRAIETGGPITPIALASRPGRKNEVEGGGLLLRVGNSKFGNDPTFFWMQEKVLKGDGI